MSRRFAALALVTLGAGCGHRAGGEGAPAASSSSGASASPPPPTTATADPAIEALARAAVGCAAYDGALDSSCPAMRAWSEAKEGFDGKAEGTLVAMLADGDEKMRYLGAYKLKQCGAAFVGDPALAARVVAAAEKEQSPLVAFELGSVVGHVRVSATGTFDRIAAMVKKHAVRNVRRGILDELLLNNQDSAPVYDLVRGAIADPDPAVASLALHSFWMGGSRHPEETCQVYADNEDNHDEELAAEAANALSWSGHCASRYDALLASLERRVKTGVSALTSPSFVSAARHVCEDAKATDAQRRRAAQIGRQVAGKKELAGFLRSGALDTVLRCDGGAGGRAFIGRFKADPDKALADKARELLAGK